MGMNIVPLPQRPPVSDTEPLCDNGSEHDEWHYNQIGNRTKSWAFSCHVRYVSGAEGDRLRGELAAVIRDLLDWAASQRADQADTQEAA
ncbi:hypothetical protein [Lentzea sp. NPDC060358]|uniref:hypothetical protein n=1 Tax=Lentzea sp. NPDC060358 TaxID=3347103 RepID=UPI0036472A38